MQDGSSGMDPINLLAWSGPAAAYIAGLKNMLGAIRDNLEVLVKSKTPSIVSGQSVSVCLGHIPGRHSIRRHQLR